MSVLRKICQVCGNNLLGETAYIDKFEYNLFKNKKIVICQNCGFGQIQTQIEKSDLIEFYENFYRSKKSRTPINFKSAKLNHKRLDYRSVSQILLGSQYLNYQHVYKFLDIGAGLGSSFISAKKILKNVKIFVIEANTDAKEFYKKNFDDITIIDSLKDVKEKMDIVLMSHTVEHINFSDVEDLFRDLYGNLEDNGILIIEVPHADLRDKLFINNRYNDTPHLNFFSLESLKMFVKKTEFEICYVNTVGQLQTEKYKGKSKGFLRNSVRKMAIRLGLNKSIQSAYTKWTYRYDFYDNLNFKYGGNRDLLRCILKKK